jgi:hypothetical protein
MEEVSMGFFVENLKRGEEAFEKTSKKRTRSRRLHALEAVIANP